jgi:hypothetical protein
LLGLSSGSTASKVFFFGNETASELQLHFVDLKVVYGTVKNKTKKILLNLDYNVCINLSSSSFKVVGISNKLLAKRRLKEARLAKSRQ